jgi:hypothetical protein
MPLAAAIVKALFEIVGIERQLRLEAERVVKLHVPNFITP